jgi:hypothetical protein
VERTLVLESTDGKGREATFNASVEELTAMVASLRADKSNAVNAVEKRWR